MSFFHTLAHLFHPRRSNNHRPRILHPEAFLAFVLIAAGFFFALFPIRSLIEQAGYVLGFASNISAGDVVARTNAERAKAGLPPLTVNSKLNEAAVAKAQNMFQNQYWAHVGPDGTEPWAFFKTAKYAYSAAGENLARDFSNSDDMMSAWMASPTHKANIMNGRYKEIGIAVVDGKLLGTETTLVVQHFGAPFSGQVEAADDKVAVKPAAQPSLAQKPVEVPAVVPASPVPTELPSVTNTPVSPTEVSLFAEQNQSSILGGIVIPAEVLKSSPLFSPLQLMKAFFLALIFVIVTTLVYDSFITSQRNTVRVVGKNFAHILLFSMIAFLLIFFKGGVVG